MLLAFVLASTISFRMPQWSAWDCEHPAVGVPAGVGRVLVYFQNVSRGDGRWVQRWGMTIRPAGRLDGTLRRYGVPVQDCAPGDSCAALVAARDSAGNWIPRECEPMVRWRVR